MDIFAKTPQVSVVTRTKTQVFTTATMLVIGVGSVLSLGASLWAGMSYGFVSIATESVPSCVGTEIDCDNDGITNYVDNCTERANSTQIDSNGDWYGNACDADYNNDGIVGTQDFLFFRQSFGATSTQANYNADVDCNGDNVIGTPDYLCFKSLFGKPPGPSAVITTFSPFGATTPDILEGSQDVTLGQVKAVVTGEPITVSEIGWRFLITSPSGATTTNITNVEILNSNGQVIA